ncbi:DUF4190 domain-containing protein [Gordonia sp. C13]|uniref:DUF4190 domain-containing protein n=1 Tax=Gordonia sp. C13 TaxID=2935078 RepID=UPI00200B97BB|nr:DUF4190 domain-containing protein [Gordonia sp. C13]MCK8612730.1 hypothetical protein [Gordonia sp. C13]
MPSVRREGSRVVLNPTETPEVETRKPEETTNLCACISLFAALLGLIPVTIVFALIALSESKRRPYERGAGIAVSALLISVVQITVMLIVLWKLELPPFGGWIDQYRV